VVQDLIEAIRKEFALSLDGIHGALHWARVRDNGLRLATTPSVSAMAGISTTGGGQRNS
jgi:hypothetical protein